MINFLIFFITTYRKLIFLILPIMGYLRNGTTLLKDNSIVAWQSSHIMDTQRSDDE